MTKDERDQLIIRYFKDEMSPSEREQFEEEVQANSELKEEVDLFRNLNLAFFEIEKEKFKNHHLKALKYSLQAGNSFRSGFKVVFSIIAASLLLIAVTWSLFISKDIDKEDIYFAHFEPYPNVEYPITRGSNDLKMEAFSRYEMQDYKNAIHLFEKLSELQSERLHSYYFYSGISYMGLSDFKTALLKFEWVLEFDTKKYKEPALWYKSLCLLKLEENERSKLILKEIVDKESEFAEKAASMLRMIEEKEKIQNK